MLTMGPNAAEELQKSQFLVLKAFPKADASRQPVYRYLCASGSASKFESKRPSRRAK